MKVLIVDSSSTDGTPELARAAGFKVWSIPRDEFNHGNTRHRAAELVPDCDILVYLTQDAILNGANAIENLVSAFTTILRSRPLTGGNSRDWARCR